MPIHQNKDGTWQWGKSGKKYKNREDAVKQMKAIFASGYTEKKASYSDVLGLNKEAGTFSINTNIWDAREAPMKELGVTDWPVFNEYIHFRNPWMNSKGLQRGQILDYGTKQDFDQWKAWKDKKVPSIVQESKIPSQQFLSYTGQSIPSALVAAGYSMGLSPDQKRLSLSTKAHPLKRDLALYGGNNSAIEAYRQRFQYAQRMRAEKAGLRYVPGSIYPVPYNKIFNSSQPVQRSSRQSKYQIAQGNERPYSDYVNSSGSISPGLFYDSNPISVLFHQLGHTMTRGILSGTQQSPRIFSRALSGDLGRQAYFKFSDILAKRKRDKSSGSLTDWYKPDTKIHPASSYFNSGVQAATGFHQLFGVAASHGKFLKNYNQLLPWLTEQGYVVNNPQTGQLTVGKPIPVLSTAQDSEHNDNSGIYDFIRMQNYLRGLERKNNRTPQEQAELKEARKRLMDLSQVADIRGANPGLDQPIQKAATLIRRKNHMLYSDIVTKLPFKSTEII